MLGIIARNSLPSIVTNSCEKYAMLTKGLQRQQEIGNFGGIKGQEITDSQIQQLFFVATW
jgi:hypothetical protein